jgi:hypothetical protein
MASISPPTVLNLTLDLNSSAQAPAPGVLKTLDLVAGAPVDFDLRLRIVRDTSVFKFSFTGLEEKPHPGHVQTLRPDLEGSTMTPETQMEDGVEFEGEELEVHDLLHSSDAESIGSDVPISRRKQQRRKPLHHRAVWDESYRETDHESEGEAENKPHRSKRKRPAPGAMADPPQGYTRSPCYRFRFT